MDFFHINCFITVAETLNFSTASRILNITQPTLSRRIQELENELNTKLFDRDHHSVKLTKYGSLLLPYAHSVLLAQNEFLNCGQGFAQGKIGKINIGFLGNTQYWVAPMIRTFRADCPEITISLKKRDYRNLMESMEEGQTDIAICYTADNMRTVANLGLTERKIGSVMLQLIASKDAQIDTDAEGKVSFNEVSRHPMILLNHTHSPLIHQKIYSLCSEHNILPNLFMEADSADELYTYVESGCGITISPGKFKYSESNRLKSYLFSDVTQEIPVSMLWNKSNLNPSLHQFISFMEQKRMFID